MENEILSAINSLKNDYENGSTTIAKNSIDVFTKVVNSYSYDIGKIRKAAELIINAKPGMSALRNIISMCLEKIEFMQEPYNFDKAANEMKSYMDHATKNVINNAIKIIEPLSPIEFSIVTASYSSTVNKLFSELKKRDHPLEVYALESIWNNTDYALSVINSCKKEGIISYHIKENELMANIDQIDFAVIGADSFYDDGSVLNGTPSKLLAEHCFNNIPFFTLAESFKKSSSDNIHKEDGFDLIPARLVTRIINE